MTQLKLRTPLAPLVETPAPALKVKKIPAIILDFETEAIDRRPAYPPQPVSFSIKWPQDRKPRFRAWGHPAEYGGNNCTREEAGAELKAAWRSDLPIVCHHGKFDLEVAERHFELPLPAWDRCHDTEFLLFLQDPHAFSLELKPSAERILGLKPEERDAVKEWVLAHVPGARPKDWGAHISKAPASLVGPYACGDVTRTERLFYQGMAYVTAHDMGAAYDRERRVMPIFLRNEQAGIRLDVDRLEQDFVCYTKALEYADNWIRKQLRKPDLNIDTDKDFGEALAAQDAVTEWTWTPGGKGRAPQRSVSKKNLLISHFRDKKLALVYAYRNRAATCLRMFMGPWLELQRGGYIRCNWNQVRRGDSKAGYSGTRTGRPSTDEPNFLAISKSWEDKDDGYVHPKFLAALPPLPLVRQYMLPDKGEVWGHRDYNQQELRMLAHFEGAQLMDNYRARPWRLANGKFRFDIHSSVQAGVREIAGLELSRPGTKILNFSDVYGKGLANLAESLGVSLEETKLIRTAKNNLMPGVPALIQAIQLRGKQGRAIRTWGGREYYAEAPMYVKKFKRVMDFFYKLTNYLIQGSSADVTKEALYRYDQHPKRRGRFLVTVYDEINASMPRSRAGLEQEMLALRESMESVECDVPMLSDGKTGPNWAAIKSCWDGLKAERLEAVQIQPWW